MFLAGLLLSPLHLDDSFKGSRIYLKTNNHAREKFFKEYIKHKVIGGFSSRQKTQEYLICWKSKGTFQSHCVIVIAQILFVSFADILESREMPLFRVKFVSVIS